MRNVLLTIQGLDRPGLVEQIASEISSAQGNWLESRLANLAGHFTGMVLTEIPEKHLKQFYDGIESLSDQSLHILSTQPGKNSPSFVGKQALIKIVANDRPDIIASVSRVLADLQLNVEELFTSCQPAAMSNEMMFHAEARISADELDENNIQEKLELLSDDLVVEFETID